MHQVVSDREIPVSVQAAVRRTYDFELSGLTGAHQADALIASGNLAVTADLMGSLADLAVVSRTGVGYDNVDVEAATDLGIMVCLAVDAPTVSTAEHALTLAMAVSKRLLPARRALLDGRRDVFNDFDGLELKGAVMGIVGFGRIGKHLAVLSRGIGMRVLAYDPYQSADNFVLAGVEQVTFEELLSQSDIVSVHVPLRTETSGLIDKAALAKLRRGAIVINTARGGVVDHAALLDALESGRLSGAGLDVLDFEDPVADELMVHPNVMATPHIAGATSASRERLWLTALTQAIDSLEGVQPAGLLNVDVWDRHKASLDNRSIAG